MANRRPTRWLPKIGLTATTLAMSILALPEVELAVSSEVPPCWFFKPLIVN